MATLRKVILSVSFSLLVQNVLAQTGGEEIIGSLLCRYVHSLVVGRLFDEAGLIPVPKALTLFLQA